MKSGLRRFIGLRFMAGTNWNNSVTWADVSPPNFSTQDFYRDGESCKDLYANIPETANDDYVTKLAQLIKYGSDGKNPYTGPRAHPVYALRTAHISMIFRSVWDDAAMGNVARPLHVVVLREGVEFPAPAFPLRGTTLQFDAPAGAACRFYRRTE